MMKEWNRKHSPRIRYSETGCSWEGSNLDEKYLRPAISPDAAVEASAADQGLEGLTPARQREEEPVLAVTKNPGVRAASQMREHMRKSSQISDRMRSRDITWMTGEIPVNAETPDTGRWANTPAAQQLTSPRLNTFVKTRDEAPAQNANAPMQGLLQGTVRQILSQTAGGRIQNAPTMAERIGTPSAQGGYPAQRLFAPNFENRSTWGN
jgi:hypothetical protein